VTNLKHLGVSNYLYKLHLTQKKISTKMNQSEVEFQSNRRSFLKRGALAVGAATVYSAPVKARLANKADAIPPKEI
jgi:hypothetical protein